MSRYYLAGAAVIVAGLIAAALIVALVTGGAQELLPADTPEGTVQRYLRALEDEDYEEAYGHLSRELRARCSLSDFLRMVPSTEVRDSAVTLERTRTFDDTAVVTASVSFFEPGFPLDSGEQTYERTFELRRESGKWRMSGPEWWCPPFR